MEPSFSMTMAQRPLRSPMPAAQPYFSENFVFVSDNNNCVGISQWHQVEMG